jgi:hypothetical protein
MRNKLVKTSRAPTDLLADRSISSEFAMIRGELSAQSYRHRSSAGPSSLYEAATLGLVELRRCAFALHQHA